MSSLQNMIKKLGLEDKVGVRDPNRSPASEPESKPVMMDESYLPENQDLSPELIERVKNYENSIKKGYNPETDTWIPHESIEGGERTVGFGDKLYMGKYGPDMTKKILQYGMSSSQAEQALRENLLKAKRDAEAIMEMKGISNLDPIQKEALTEMVFQMGRKGTLGFPNMLSALQKGDTDTAYNEALDSKWARQDSPQRAKEVAQRLRYGKLAHKLAKK
jgi:GH24 family phage-related lysozyme (muramidase)